MRAACFALLVAVSLVLVVPASAGDRFFFNPESDEPGQSHGGRSYLEVDGSPQAQAFLRFRVSGISGRAVTGVRLRLFSQDSSSSGGAVYPLVSTGWDETTTWNTRPAFGGAPLASFGPVADHLWYEVDLGPLVTGDGVVSLALASTERDAAEWSSRESIDPPQLVVEVAPAPGVVLDGLSQIAAPNVGSSDPTYFASNRRLARTEKGRLLAVFGRHSDGLQLAWRDPASGWQSVTRGTVTDGVLLRGTRSGDWPASIAVGRDRSGREHAWVVWSGSDPQEPHSLELRRLSDLDAADGPVVGPAVVLHGAVGARPDIAFLTLPDGSSAGAVLWIRAAGGESFQVATGWLDDLGSDEPALTSVSKVTAEGSSKLGGTLVPGRDRMGLVARVRNGGLRLFESQGALSSRWSARAAGRFKPSGRVRPSAVRLRTGAVLAAAESDSDRGIVTVLEFSPSGSSVRTTLRLAGYSEPTIASDGGRAWLVAVRRSDRAVVSRQFDGRRWSRVDRVEIGPDQGGGYSWPNVLREVDGRLRLVVRGPRGITPVRSAVLAYQRPV